jgi:hypothetical protein
VLVTKGEKHIMLAGAIADVVSKLELEAKGDAAVRAEALDQLERKDSDRHSSNKAIVHHYKVTKTSTVEVDDSIQEKDDSEKDDIKVSKKEKKRGCFSGCFGKFGK